MLGWREAVSFPEWELAGVKAKVDTGARTSALHVEEVTPIDGDRVRFRTVRHRDENVHHEITAPVLRVSRVRPSSGVVEERYVVRTTINIGPLVERVEISLVSREGMLCLMLVGRNALPEGVLVDPHRRYLHGRPLRRRARS